MADYFDLKLAYNEQTGSPLPGAVAQVFAPSDTAFTTPLAITDVSDVPLSQLTAGPNGVYQAFKCPGYSQVLAVSGDVVTPISSRFGDVFSVVPDPSEVTDPLALIAVDGVYQLVPRGSGDGVDTTGSLDGQFLQSTGPTTPPVWTDPPTSGGISGAPSSWPSVFPPDTHTHASGSITDASSVGRSVLTAVDAQAARQAIGAGTGNGTSNLTIGTTGTTAAAGNHSHNASSLPFTPTGSITATDVQGAIVQAASTGSGSGVQETRTVLYASGAYPTQPATAPTGVKVRHFYGPVQYTGPTWPGVLDVYTYAELT